MACHTNYSAHTELVKRFGRIQTEIVTDTLLEVVKPQHLANAYSQILRSERCRSMLDAGMPEEAARLILQPLFNK